MKTNIVISRLDMQKSLQKLRAFLKAGSRRKGMIVNFAHR